MAQVKETDAFELAELTFKLLTNCQEKEVKLAEQYGLTQSEFRCLRLFTKESVINNKELAQAMGLSASRLTRIVDGLVKKKYVLREIDPSDRRNMKVSLSKKGNEIAIKLNKAYIEIHKQILQNIDNSDHPSLISGMKKLLSALENWIKER